MGAAWAAAAPADGRPRSPPRMARGPWGPAVGDVQVLYHHQALYETNEIASMYAVRRIKEALQASGGAALNSRAGPARMRSRVTAAAKSMECAGKRLREA